MSNLVGLFSFFLRTGEGGGETVCVERRHSLLVCMLMSCFYIVHIYIVHIVHSFSGR